MTRIIAGSAGGRRLSTPSGEVIRPTSDRVREAVFSTLESTLGTFAGLRFLDLFAGSGAVGLEAMSRGAEHATLVEQHRATAAIARRNVRALGFASVDVVVLRAESFVRHGPDPEAVGTGFDVAFLDPPYAMPGDQVTEVLSDLVAHRWLRADAVVAVERSTHASDLGWPAGIRGERMKRYGETVVWYGRAAD